MKTYNKLVRDKIPEIISSSNKTCTTRILSDREYLDELNKKLKEELNEYLESKDLEELADIEEVIRGILKANYLEYEDLEKVRIKKAAERGTFSKKIYLESVND